MKKIFFIFLLIVTSSFSNNLLIKYKAGEIKLIEDKSFTNKINCQNVFFSGKNCITVDYQGNIFVSEQKEHCIYKFNKNGNFIKKFGRFGQAPGDLQYPGTLSIFDNGNLAVSEYSLLKRISIFDTSGKFLKYLRLSYPNSDFASIDNFIIAKNEKCLENEKTHIYFESIDSVNRKKYSLFDYSFSYKRIEIKPKFGGTFSLKPFFREEYFLRSFSDKFLTGNTSKAEINLYSKKGILQNKIELNLKPKKVPETIKKRFVSEVLKGLKRTKIKVSETFLEKQIENLNLPYYQDIVNDRDGNILIIEFRSILETSNKLKFQVYDKNGKYLCTSSFVSDKLKNLNGYSFLQSQSLYFFENSVYVFMENTDNPDEPYYEVVKFDIPQ